MAKQRKCVSLYYYVSSKAAFFFFVATANCAALRFDTRSAVCVVCAWNNSRFAATSEQPALYQHVLLGVLVVFCTLLRYIQTFGSCHVWELALQEGKAFLFFFPFFSLLYIECILTNVAILQLITSPHFHYYVRIIHALMNDLPPPKPPNFPNVFQQHAYRQRSQQFKKIRYVPTVRQKGNMYFYIWRQEMKNAFLFRK